MSDFQFTIDRDAFADAVTWVARALPAKPLNPVLGGIRLSSAHHGSLSLQAFDYEVAAAMKTAADVTDPGAALVSGRLLQAIVKACGRKPVTFCIEGAVARITCGAAEFTLPTMVDADFPELPKPPADAGSVDASQLAEAVGQTAFAVYRGADGYANIKAICFDVADHGDPALGKGGLRLAATDRYRVAVKSIPWQPTLDADGAPPVRMLVPPRALADTSRLGGDTVNLGFEGAEPRLLAFRGDGRRTTTQLLAEEFPKLDGLFPAEYTAVATVAVPELSEALGRVLALDARDFPRVKMTFASGVLHMSGGESGVGGISEGMSIGFAGAPIDMWLNPKYLLDGLTAAHADVVDMGLVAPKRPLTLAAAGEVVPASGSTFEALRGDFRYLLMPAQPPVAG